MMTFFFISIFVLKKFCGQNHVKFLNDSLLFCDLLEYESEMIYCRKWKSLRDRYIRERRAARIKKSGPGAEHHPIWKFFYALSFLEQNLQERETHSNFYTVAQTNDIIYERVLDVTDDSGSAAISSPS